MIARKDAERRTVTARTIDAGVDRFDGREIT
jgi:hypothetical protein